MRIIKALKKIGDGYINLVGNYGQTGSNIASGGAYLNNFESRKPQELRTLYRTSFIIRRVCDSRAEDMTKAGIRIDSELDPAVVKDCQEELNGLNFWDQLADTIRWSSLFGTAFIMPIIDGQDVENPFKKESVGKGQLRGFQVFDRWQLVPSWQDGRITELGRNNGYPIYYITIANGMGIPNLKIHHTRLFRIDATPLPFYDRYTENFYSASVVESIIDRIKAFDQSTAASVSLIEAARNDVLYTDSLPQAAGENSGLYGRISEKFRQMMQFRSNNGLTVLSDTDKLERLTVTMTGVAEIIDRMAQQVSGATEIPLCRLLGMSSGGLNGGDGDLLDAYYDDTGRRQETQLKGIVSDCVHMAFLSLGVVFDKKDFGIYFYPLKKLSALAKSDIASKNTDTIIKAFESSLITQSVAMKELKQLTEETGMFSNVTDEDIEEAENAPPIPIIDVDELDDENRAAS